MDRTFEGEVAKAHKNMREVPCTDTGRYLVYILYQDEKCVYVGQSHGGLSRPYSHKLEKTFNKMYIIECKEDELGDIEALTIVEHKPELNIAIPTNNILFTKQKLKLLFGMGAYEVNKIIKDQKIKQHRGSHTSVYYWGDFYGV